MGAEPSGRSTSKFGRETTVRFGAGGLLKPTFTMGDCQHISDLQRVRLLKCGPTLNNRGRFMELPEVSRLCVAFTRLL